MANTNTAGFGLQPVMRVGNTPAIQGQSKYEIDAAETNAIYNGEPVVIDISATTGGYIVTAAAGTACVGGLNGVFYNAATTLKPTWSNYYPASTNASDLKATVYADPNIIFEVQHDETGTAAMNHGGFDFVGVGGSTITGQSTSELDTSTVTTSGGFKQIGISTDPDNSDTGSANCNAYCVFNTGEHVFKLTTGLA